MLCDNYDGITNCVRTLPFWFTILIIISFRGVGAMEIVAMDMKVISARVFIFIILASSPKVI